MDPIVEWNGRLAHALQRALRMNNETFAATLGVHERTVDMWRQNPDRVPTVELQQALDTALERADERSARRFQLIVDQQNPVEMTGVDGGRVESMTAGADAAGAGTDSPRSDIMAGDGVQVSGEGGTFMEWLQTTRVVDAPPDGSDVGQILRWYRKHQNLTQQDVATLLNTTQSRLSKIEKGSQELRDVDELRRIAEKLRIPPERLGILPDRSHESVPHPSHVSQEPGPIRDSQEHWRTVRQELNANRAVLGHLAAELYLPDQRLPGSSVLSRPAWVPDRPIDLADIALLWQDDPPAPIITGADAAAAGARPLMVPGGKPYDRYSRALRDIYRPRLLDNRISYRLLNVDWTGRTLDFGYTSYFDALDIGEAIGHEFAEAWINAGRRRPSFADLPFRRSIEDPFDLSARPMLPSINTLTIRRDAIEGHRMYLHRRDAGAVAAGGGLYHVTPAGVFQPAALAPAHQSNDFSLWRNVQREFSEEFLGNAEHDGNSTEPIRYETDEPFSSFERARLSSDFNVYACAVVLEPLTLWVELVTFAVVSAPVFDQLFAGMVEVNEEGAAVGTVAGRPSSGIPFNADTYERLQGNRMSPVALACVEQAWQHRHEFLGR